MIQLRALERARTRAAGGWRGVPARGAPLGGWRLFNVDLSQPSSPSAMSSAPPAARHLALFTTRLGSARCARVRATAHVAPSRPERNNLAIRANSDGQAVKTFGQIYLRPSAGRLFYCATSLYTRGAAFWTILWPLGSQYRSLGPAGAHSNEPKRRRSSLIKVAHLFRPQRGAWRKAAPALAQRRSVACLKRDATPGGAAGAAANDTEHHHLGKRGPSATLEPSQGGRLGPSEGARDHRNGRAVVRQSGAWP